jgi:hypothetical protein
MRHVTKYPPSEDYGRQNNLNGRLSPFGLGREVSRLLLLCEEKRIDFARWEPFRLWPNAELATLRLEVCFQEVSGPYVLRLSVSRFDPKQTCIDSKKVAATEPLQRDYLHWQSCINVQRPSFRKRSHFFNRLAWMRSRVYESARIITEADDHFINNVFHSAAVWPNNADQYNSVLDALFNEGRKLR